MGVGGELGKGEEEKGEHMHKEKHLLETWKARFRYEGSCNADRDMCNKRAAQDRDFDNIPPPHPPPPLLPCPFPRHRIAGHKNVWPLSTAKSNRTCKLRE